MTEHHQTPPEDKRPKYFPPVEYALPENVKSLTLEEFIYKVSNAPKTGRLIIAWTQDNQLRFPDEAVTNLRRDSSEINLEIVSGYYEECNVITPARIDYNRLIEILNGDAEIIAYTKGYGRHKIFDIVSFSQEVYKLENGDTVMYDYIALVI